MTLRAVLLGLLGAVIVAGFGYFNDAVMHQTYLVGNHFPVSVYGSLVIFLLVINPLLFLVWKRLAISGHEIAVILTLTLAACVIPGSGLLRTFTTTLVLPYSCVKTISGWGVSQDPNTWRPGKTAIQALPPHMLTDVTPQNEDTVLNAFTNGMRKGETNITPQQVPWGAWTGTLTFWVPLILILWIGLMGLSLVVHRQWADHEQLPYPIATFANALLPGDGKNILSEVFTNRLFWASAISIFLIHLNNYLGTVWFPEKLILFPRTFDFGPMAVPLAVLQKGGAWWLFRPTLYFSAIAFAYFLATDVSLALGIGPILYALVVGTLVSYGITMGSGGSSDPNLANGLFFGAFVGCLLVLLYTGRRYYASVFRAVFFLPSSDRPTTEAVWGGRLFVLCMAGFVVYSSVLGQFDWQLAVIYVGCLVLIFLVLSRIVAETGAFFVQANFYPTAVMMGLFGAGALGPKSILLILMFSSILLVDPREALMPFFTNSLKMLDLRKVSPGKTTSVAILAVVIALVLAVPITLYCQYNYGMNKSDIWSTAIVPTFAFNGLVSAETRLASQGRLAEAARVSGWGHFAHLAPDPLFVLACVIGIALILLFTMGRLRFSKWPIHPVMFLIWGTYPGTLFAISFLVGWFIKSLVTKFGGGTLYRNLKPVMFGVIAGEVVAGVVVLLITGLAYLFWNIPAKSFGIMPG